MHLDQRITAFVKLGDFIRHFIDNSPDFKASAVGDTQDYDNFGALITKARHHNAWFTQEQIITALEGWAANLTEKK